MWRWDLKLFKSLQDVFFFDVLFVEVKRVNFDRDIHRVFHLNAGDGSGTVREYGTHFNGIRYEIHLEVNSLSLGIDDEDLGVVLAFEVDLLEELFVDVRSKHHIHCLFLSRQQST